jgi:FKBP-type peptidyl-prolyl cis-trans isomerase FklB
MKKAFSIALLLTIVLQVQAQKPAAKPAASPAAKKPAAPAAAPALKNAMDSFSYAIGASVANFYKEQGITNINAALLSKALTDNKQGKMLLDENQTNTVIMNFMQAIKSEKASVTRKAGEAFLAENKKKPGVITTASGLQYYILKEGTGTKPSATDKVKVHYHGTLIDGTVFDSSVERGEPIELAVNGVIQGCR